MRIWAKYLIIGWSIVCIGVIIVSFQIMKKEFIQEDYAIDLPLCQPELLGENIKRIGNIIYYNKEFLSKDEFIEQIKGVKSIELKSRHKVNNQIYIFLPLYAFGIWAIPIFVFSLVGNLFSRKKDDVK